MAALALTTACAPANQLVDDAAPAVTEEMVSSPSVSPPSSVTGGSRGTVEPTDFTLVLAAGDIARCDSEGDEVVADLVEGMLLQRPAIVLALGDLAYPDGSPSDFACYDQSWGRFKDRTRPAVGNHDYHTAGATGYFDYFGSAAGDPRWGYYSLDVDHNWHIVVLNSNCSEIDAGEADNGCAEGSPQERWLRSDLEAAAGMNVLVAAHHPRWMHNEYDDLGVLDSLYEVAFEYDADIWLGGHEHHYERYRPLDPDGEHDPECGIRQFIVGTGGGTLRGEKRAPSPQSELRRFDEHGVLALELMPDSYRWSFSVAPDGTVADEGAAQVVGGSDEDSTGSCGRR